MPSSIVTKVKLILPIDPDYRQQAIKEAMDRESAPSSGVPTTGGREFATALLPTVRTRHDLANPLGGHLADTVGFEQVRRLGGHHRLDAPEFVE